MSEQIVRIELNGTLVLLFRPFQVPIALSKHAPKGRMRFRECRIERDGMNGCGLCLVIDMSQHISGFARNGLSYTRAGSRCGSKRITVGKTAVGKRVRRVDLDRSLEIRDRLR